MLLPRAGVHRQSGRKHRTQAQWLPQLHRRPGGLQHDSRRGEVLLHNLLLCLLLYYFNKYYIFVQAEKCIMQAGNRFNMVIERWVEMVTH